MTHLYSKKVYADASAELGPIVRIECLDIWVQVRDIPGTNLKDAIGLYPFSLPTEPQSPEQLRSELKNLDLLSLVLVAAPFLSDVSWLSSTFDMARVYKTQFTVEGAPEKRVFKKNIRYVIRKAQAVCTVQKIELSDYLDRWCELYGTLITKHDLKGIHRFSRNYFESLANISEISTFGAFVDGNLVSASLWIEDANWVTGHLSGTNKIGYGTGANHALFDYVVRHYEGRNINLGGAPDSPKQGTDLSLFKRKFANATQDSWICGIVADQSICNRLNQDRNINESQTDYFPAYRKPD